MLTRTPSDALHLPAGRTRDPRLDVFRGAAMVIILVAHVPGNSWALWIPARFGFSDATEIFVFLSGMASALAFGPRFDAGVSIGMASIIRRIWLIYQAHLMVFVVTAAMMAAAGSRPGNGGTYIQALNLTFFFEDAMALLPALLSLTYVPNYFDILPMYLVILALIPPMVMAERGHALLPIALTVVLWGAAQARWLDLPAEPWSDRTWFFNPFAWQLLFFTGFFLMRRTVTAPPPCEWLLAVAALIVLAAVPVSHFRLLQAVPALADAAAQIGPLIDKTRFGILRYIHFLALAYLVVHLAGAGGRRLRTRPLVVLELVGRQSLAVFVFGMVAAQALGMLLDATGRGAIATSAANLLGFGLLVFVAFVAEWCKTVRPTRR